MKALLALPRKTERRLKQLADILTIPGIVLGLVATVIVGTYVFAYASHCFLTVVEQTSAGNDEVVWPNEPYQDWLHPPL